MGFFTNKTFTIDVTKTDSQVEKSGLTYDWDNDHIYALSDNLSIRRLTRLGVPVGADITITNPPFTDTEGIAYIGGGRFAILNEDPVKIFTFAMGPGTTSIAQGDVTTFTLPNITVFVGGFGAEGMAYDPVEDVYYVGVQSVQVNEGSLWKVDLKPVTPTETRLFYWNDKLVSTGHITTAAFVSDLFWGGQTGAPGSIFVLTRDTTSQNRKVIEIDLQGNVLSTFTHNIAGQIEGIAFDRLRNDMFITGEPVTDNLWRYTENPITTALLAYESTWSYSNDNSDKYTDGFYNESYVPTGWSSGQGTFAQGTLDSLPTTVNTTLSNPAGDNRSDYFIKDVTINNLSQYTSLSCSVIHDDGVVIWVNGTEVFRSSSVVGALSHGKVVTAANEGVPTNFTLTDLSMFHEGTNRIAVMLFDAGAASTDIGFDLKINGNKSDIPGYKGRNVLFTLA